MATTVKGTIPYGKQCIDATDLAAVNEALCADYLTTGPAVQRFEEAFAKYVGAKYAIAVSNGTAALHLAALAADLKKGDEVITTPLTFAASANCARYCGADPAFVDIKEDGQIDEKRIEAAISPKTRIIIPVHYAGFCVELEAIRAIAKKRNIIVIEDACHAVGARYKNTRIGDCTYSDMAVFSFHPVKHITTGEGGMITTNSATLNTRLRMLRAHGITKDPQQFAHANPGAWYYEMQDLGFNYRITDFQCALGLSQLGRIDDFLKRRRQIAQKYDAAFMKEKRVRIIHASAQSQSAYHLYPLLINDEKRKPAVFAALQQMGIGVQVHYIPIYAHPYYQRTGYKNVHCPNAERFYAQEISLPMYADLTDTQVAEVIACVGKAL